MTANRSLRDGIYFRDESVFLSDEKTTSQKNRVTDSVYIRILEPERFYMYGLFFSHNVFYKDWNIHVKYIEKSTQRYMNIFILCT